MDKDLEKVQRWTAKRRATLVMSIWKGETSAQQAARKHGLTVGEVERCEDGVPHGPADSLHDIVRNQGRGAYSMWGNYLYFSTPDNSDPASNGRSYSLVDARDL